jgi:2Fe-2S ferredoxin
MVKIVIENLGQKEVGANDPSSTSVTEGKAHGPLLRLIQEAGIDWMSDCGGQGKCTSCKAIVISGADNLTGTTPAEHKYRDMGVLSSNERLTCQVRVKGDVVIKVPEEFKLKHMKYT